MIEILGKLTWMALTVSFVWGAKRTFSRSEIDSAVYTFCGVMSFYVLLKAFCVVP